MKATFYKYFTCWMLLGLALSCTKESKLTGVSSLTVVNAVAGSDPYLIPYFGDKDPKSRFIFGYQLRYGAPLLTGSFSGKQKLVIYHYPDTSAHSTPLYNVA